jgi:hypothetical protein
MKLNLLARLTVDLVKISPQLQNKDQQQARPTSHPIDFRELRATQIAVLGALEIIFAIELAVAESNHIPISVFLVSL